MEPGFIRLNEITAVGIGVRTTNQKELNQTTVEIPGLWNKFFAEGLAENIPNRVDSDRLMGIYTNYESDHTGEYDLIISSEVGSLDEIPEGMVGVTIPDSEYLVFNAQGQMPGAVFQTWNYIWGYFSENSEYEWLYSADFELYKSDTEVDIHIAVKKHINHLDIL